jgi:hypothetical protein
MSGKTTGYLLVVQIPIELRSKTTEMKNAFFRPFKTAPH